MAAARPVERWWRRTRRVLGRIRAIATGRARVPPPRAVAKRLPPGAQHALRRGHRVALDGRRTAEPLARDAYRRLPAPAQAGVRRGVTAVRVRRAGPHTGLGPLGPLGTRPPATLKPARGPALRTWRQGYRDLVAQAVPAGTRWLLVRAGAPAGARGTRPTGATSFPTDAGNRPLPHDLAYVAQLEAARFAGHDRLVVPEGSRPWFAQRAELRGHVTSSYPVVADRPDAGTVFDLARRVDRPSDAGGSLRSVVATHTRDLPGVPAVLDWTARGIAGELPGVTTFRPPPGDRLPYLGGSLEVVVVDDDRAVEEARRVASRCIVRVADGVGGTVSVVDVEVVHAPAAAERSSVVLWAADGDAAWRRALTEAADAAGAEVRWAPLAAGGPGDLAGVDVVVLVEAHVLPLPGTLARLADLATTAPDTAIAGKVLLGDGRLEAAGGTVFADGSTALVAHGSIDVRAPWHDFVRPVCWAPGLLAVPAARWAAVDAPAGLEGRPFLREWAASAWAAGHAVTYHPAVVAVRLVGAPRPDAAPAPDSRWRRVLELRPRRPRSLGDAAWAELLAGDDVEACRR